MTQHRKLYRILSLATFALMFLSAASVLAAGDDKTTTITITDPNASLLLVLGKGPKGTTLPPVTVPPSQDGHQFKIDPQLFGSAPLPSGLTTYDCGGGKFVVAVQGANIDDVCPKENRKELGYIPLGGSGTISTLPDGITHQQTVTSGGGATQPGRGGVGHAITESVSTKPRLFWEQVGVGLGAKKFSSVNNCSSILSVIPGAACRAQDNSSGFGVEGAVGFTPYVAASVGYFNFGSIHRMATAPTLAENSSFHTQFETITGRAILPIGRFSFFADGGVAFWQNHLKENQGVGSGSTFTTVTTSFNINGTSPTVGGGFQYNPCRHFGVGADVKYFHAKKAPALNESDLEAVAMFNFRF